MRRALLTRPWYIHYLWIYLKSFFNLGTVPFGAMNSIGLATSCVKGSLVYLSLNQILKQAPLG